MPILAHFPLLQAPVSAYLSFIFCEIFHSFSEETVHFQENKLLLFPQLLIDLLGFLAPLLTPFFGHIRCKQLGIGFLRLFLYRKPSKVKRIISTHSHISFYIFLIHTFIYASIPSLKSLSNKSIL